MSISRTGVINDLHIPFHDPKLVDLVIDAFVDIKIDRLIINGDLLDFYNLNSYSPAHSDVIHTLEDELTAGKDWLTELRDKLPKCEIVFLYGNHEDRLDRWVTKNTKVFHNILKLEYMLDLERLNVSYHYYNYAYQLESTNLYVQHSPPSYGVNGARTSLLKKHDATFIYGCTHRKQVAAVTGWSGQIYTCYFNGWLGSTTLTPEHTRVFSYAKGHEDWQPAAAVVTCINEIDFLVDQIDIDPINYRLLLDGAIYEA